MEADKPGIRGAHRSRSGSFSRLVARLQESPEALDALVYAYAELADDARRELIRVTVQDAADPLVALAAFLAVEEEPAVRLRLRGLLHKHGHVDRRAWTWGTSAEGGAALTQALGGLRPEALELRWNDHEISEIGVKTGTLGSFPDDAYARTPAEVVELITPRLWRHLRRGYRLPPGADRFAGFFSLR